MTGPTGDQLVEMLAALANPLRLRIVAKLASGRDYVSHLAREIGVSRPLLHMHLQKLEAAGLVVGNLELSEDGKAMKRLEDEVRFRRFEVEREELPIESGRAYLYFWPGGQTERAAIQLQLGDDPDEILTVLVSPLTGRTKVEEGAHALPRPRDQLTTREHPSEGGMHEFGMRELCE